MADVGERDDTAHGFGIVALEGVVQGEGLDVDHAGIEADLTQQCQLRFDQLALGRHQQHLHLQAIGIGIEDLEVEFDTFRIEGDVLVGLPADHLAGLRLLHSVHGDLLDDDVAAADGNHHVAGLDLQSREQVPDSVSHQGGIHHFAFDDGVVGERLNGDPLEDGLS